MTRESRTTHEESNEQPPLTALHATSGNRPRASDAAPTDESVGYGLAEHLSPALARRAAESDCPILITGETGVGKGYLAEWIHQVSPRHDGPFIPINCGAIPESLVDSQLFGHVRGAFSGATADHTGLIRAATNGTLLLDEVSELPRSAQKRLLRLLQEREVQPVGHPRPVVVDVRVIAATNVDLFDSARRRMFREDLLFRLDVIRLHVRPLRERRRDIPQLISNFNGQLARLYGQPPLEFTDDASQLLLSHAWPGNIRQLRTVIERLHVLCPGRQIDAATIRQIGNLQESQAPPAHRSMDALRQEELRRVLDEAGGSVSRAALVFGVHRSTIYRWLKDQRPPSA